MSNLFSFSRPTVAHFHTLWTSQTETAQLELWHFLAFRSGSRISKRREGREGLITGSAKLNTRLNGFHACRNRNRVCCMKCCRLTRSAEGLQTYLVVIFKSSRPAVSGGAGLTAQGSVWSHVKINCLEISVWVPARRGQAGQGRRDHPGQTDIGGKLHSIWSPAQTT